MKRLINAYIDLSVTLRLGILGLSGMVLIYLLVRLVFNNYIHPNEDENDEKQFIAAWNRFKYTSDSTAAGEDKLAQVNVESFSFNPNTLDSAGFRRLGLKEKTTHLLLNWRRKGKKFYKKEDLKPLYTLTEAEYNRISSFIYFGNERTKSQNENKALSSAELNKIVELNHADSFSLVRVNGIGPSLAHKIIERRNLLGGFISHEQLLEIYPFSDTAYKTLKKRLEINSSGIKKLSLNNASFEQLKLHPYIGEKTAKNIIQFREVVKRFDYLEQLKQVPLMNEEIYRKIAPYISLD